MTPTRPDHALDLGQRGSAMLLVATLLVALLAGGGVALYIELQGTKSADMVKASDTSLYCAEAGLVVARPIIAANYLAWPTLLDGDPANDPSWYPVRGDIDGDGVDDYEVTIKDNDDEVPPAPSDPTFDNDRRVFAISRCLKTGETSKQVMELLSVSGGGHVYRHQSGGGGFNTGNRNH